MTEEFITTAEVAALVGVTSRTVQQWRARGTGPLFQRVGKTYVVYDRAEVERWLREDYQPRGGAGAHKK